MGNNIVSYYLNSTKIISQPWWEIFTMVTLFYWLTLLSLCVDRCYLFTLNFLNFMYTYIYFACFVSLMVLDLLLSDPDGLLGSSHLTSVECFQWSSGIT